MQTPFAPPAGLLACWLSESAGCQNTVTKLKQRVSTGFAVRKQNEMEVEIRNLKQHMEGLRQT